MECRICASESVAGRYRVREMRNGTGEEFDYFQCAGCGCVQIGEIPADLARYRISGQESLKPRGTVDRFLDEARTRRLTGGGGLLGWAMLRVRPPEQDESVAPEGVSPSARLLQVGCGNGQYLQRLFDLGFRNLHGIDPMMDPDSVSLEPIRLERRSILEMDPAEGPFDCILFDHTLEQIPNQHGAMVRAAELLATDGVCVLHMAWADSDAWERYRENWVRLDAPRNLHLHTRNSLGLLAREAGLRIERMVFDSDAVGFWGSEQNARGISLNGPRSWLTDRQHAPFTEAQIQSFERKARELNAVERGDQVTVYLRREGEA